jgi:predicted nicotinamide N-methyase
MSHDLQIEYRLKKEREKIGSFDLEIECLDDLNKTIDQVFLYLEKLGNPQALEELCPYFGVIWPSARGLSEFISSLPDHELQNHSVLEMGCGLALPGMIAAKRGARVLATDFHPQVPRFLERNIRNNHLNNLSYLRVNWETENPELELFDWVIGSDVLYESRYAETLARAIQKHLKPQGKVVLADPGRPYLQAFVDMMKSFGFTYETKVFRVPHPPQMQDVFVLIFHHSEKR